MEGALVVFAVKGVINGDSVGLFDKSITRLAEGLRDGANDGSTDGDILGPKVGPLLGLIVGDVDGDKLGLLVGSRTHVLPLPTHPMSQIQKNDESVSTHSALMSHGEFPLEGAHS